MAEASAPASSANLGPGFDTVALALELRCRVVCHRADEWSIVHHGPERLQSSDPGDDAVLLTAQKVSPDPMEIEVFNDIPLCRGLGSSSAAYAAAAMATLRAMGQDPRPADVFEIVSELEGHPDNAAAAVYGGLVAVAGQVVMHLELHPTLVPIVAVPDFELPTREARALLPENVSRLAAVRNLGRLMALVQGLKTGSAEVLKEARGDELHEAPRNERHPKVGAFVDVAVQSGAIHACWSGAGPSVLAFAPREQADRVRAALDEAMAGEGRILRPPPAFDGVR